MQVAHPVGRTAMLAGLEGFLRAVEGLSDDDFLAATRCRGWCVADLVVHVHLGLQEMLLGFLTPTKALPDTDSATYWTGSAPGQDDEAGPLGQVRFVRLLAAAYSRPSGLVAHLRPTVAAVVLATTELAPGSVASQGRVLRTGDFLAIWAAELAIHQLDLGRELDISPPAPSAAAMARQTVEALAGGAFGVGWSDAEVILVGTGRIMPTASQRAALGSMVDRLPVLS